MKYDRYEPLPISKDALEYKFSSKGPKGEILKVVQFTETDNPDIYNLSLGNLLDNGKIDHQASNNFDRNKILATVAAAVYEFTLHYPDKFIFFTGSTRGRTRLYRMILTLNFTELSRDFEIFGVSLQSTGFVAEPWIKGKDYFGFLIKKKIS